MKGKERERKNRDREIFHQDFARIIICNYVVNGAKNGDMNRRAFFIFARWAMCLTTPYKITKATSNDFDEE